MRDRKFAVKGNDGWYLLPIVDEAIRFGIVASFPGACLVVSLRPDRTLGLDRTDGKHTQEEYEALANIFMHTARKHT